MDPLTPSQKTQLATLEAWLRIPSISAQPERTPEVRAAAEFIRSYLASAGLEHASLIEGAGHPLVTADWLHAPGRPTLLLYGHYDVQPPDPLAEWTSPPFEPAVRGDTLFARGAADDKGPLMILVLAVETLLRRDGRLPINVRFLIEGEEETSGEHLARHLQSVAGQLQADAILVCDTEMFAPNLPTLSIGQRGIVYGELSVRTLESDVHSGTFGGAAPNALQAVAEIITALKARDGRIQVPGFYDAVETPSAAERATWARLPFDEDEYRVGHVGATALTGEPGRSVFERTWTRPTLEVHGIRGGYTGEGAKTVIPAAAVAKISARLVPRQTAAQATEQLRAAIAAACPPGATAKFEVLGGAEPWMVDPTNPYIQLAASVMTPIFGQETVFVRSGGSLPVLTLFDECVRAPSILFGFALPDCHAHAPNERLSLPNFFRGIAAVVAYFEALGAREHR